MDFGISLDPLAVPQRHTLYDSESDEEDEQHQNRIDQLRSVFTVDKREKSEVLTGKSLLVGIGTTAAVFVRSFLHLRKEPSFSVKGDTGSVLAGKHFPMGKDKEDVTVVYEVEGAAGKWVVCVHEGELRVEYSNFWTEKVGQSHIYNFWKLPKSLCKYCFFSLSLSLGIWPGRARRGHSLGL